MTLRKLTKIMQCSACGFQNRPEARFCYNCGRELTQPDQAHILAALSSETSTPSAGPGGSGWQPSTPLSSLQPPDPASGLFPSSGTPATLRESGGFKARGTARTVQFRSGKSLGVDGKEIQVQVLEFLLEQYDSSGNRSLVPVEMRGRSIKGLINDGDDVEVSGQWKNGLLYTTNFSNRTISSQVKAKTSRLRRTFGTGCMIIFLVLIIAIALIMFLGASSGGLLH
jgi:hypothetical protein